MVLYVLHCVRLTDRCLLAPHIQLWCLLLFPSHLRFAQALPQSPILQFLAPVTVRDGSKW